MQFSDIIYTKEEGIATIALHRPQTLNAFTHRMGQEWAEAIRDAQEDPEVRVLVVTGAGRAFCSGANPRLIGTSLGRQPLEPHKRAQPEWGGINAVPFVLKEFDKPYIGAINGPAVGGGMSLAAMCDLRIASDRARFGLAQVRMGVAPSEMAAYFVPRIIGTAKACELFWTGRIIDAEEALRIGFVNQVVPHEELVAATRELALQLARGPAVAIRLAKRLVYQCLTLDLETAFEAHQLASMIASATEDAKEGPRAWVEKREPIFKGR